MQVAREVAQRHPAVPDLDEQAAGALDQGQLTAVVDYSQEHVQLDRGSAAEAPRA